MSKNKFKILFMCLALSFSTVCVNVGAMETKPNINSNTYKTTNTLNNKNIEKIKKTKSENNLISKNLSQTKENNQITPSIKNKSAAKKTETIYPIKPFLKIFDASYYERITKKLKDPKTTDAETKNIAVNYKCLMLPRNKSLKDLIIKCVHCIKKINGFYEKFTELTKNSKPSINIIPEIRSLYVAMVNYNMHLCEISKEARKINLDEDKYKKFHNKFLSFFEKTKEVKEYLERFNPIYKDIFPFNGRRIVMHRQVDKINNTEETKKDKFLSKIAYSFIENDDEKLRIISKTPEKNMTNRLNIKNIKTNTIKETSKEKNISKTPNKKMQSIFPFYSLDYELNHIPDKTYENEIINRLMNKDTKDKEAISLINNYNLVNSIFETNKLNTKESLQCRLKYIFETIQKHWDYCDDFYKNIFATGGMNEKNNEEYKRVLRTSCAVIAHLNNHLIEIINDIPYLLKTSKTFPKLSNGNNVLKPVIDHIKVNLYKTEILNKKLKKFEPMYVYAYPYDIKKFDAKFKRIKK